MRRRDPGRSTDLAAEARARLDAGPPGARREALADVRADVVLDAGEQGAATIIAWDGCVSVRPGRTTDPVTKISGRLETLVSVVRGRCSGVEAFLRDDIAVTGNLALALQLDGLFAPGRRRGVRSRTVRAAGVGTSLVEAGPRRRRRAVVHLHGLGATNASMLPLVWELGRTHRNLAPDLPGHGASDAPRGRYDAAFFARWLLSLLDECEVDQAVLVGNSLGGRVALEVALTNPERVAALVALCPAVAFRRLRQLVPVVRVLRPELAGLPVPLTALVAPITDTAAARALRLLFARPERLSPAAYRAAAGEFARVYGSPAHRVAFSAALQQVYLDDAFGSDGFWQRLPALEVPALFVWGGRDRLVPAGFARHVRAAVPTASTVVLDDCGHVPQFELPAETARRVRSFLASLDTADLPTDQRRRRPDRPAPNRDLVPAD
jgi:pimeloyl-ACP methyl ester carboxylesterase